MTLACKRLRDEARKKENPMLKTIFAIGILLTASAPMAMAESPEAAPPLEYGYDRPGMDYRNFNLGSPNPLLCRQACNGDARCKAYTYVRPGVQGPFARCWLKYGVPAAIPRSWCVSGRAPVPELGVDRPGMDFANFNLSAANPNLCRAACYNNWRCRAWTYVRPGVQGPFARCWLKHGIPLPARSFCCSSGIK